MSWGTTRLPVKSFSFSPFCDTGNNELEKCSANDSSCHLQYAQKCILSAYLNYDSTVVDIVGAALLSDLTGVQPPAMMKK